MAGQAHRMLSMLGLVQSSDEDEYYEEGGEPMATVTPFPRGAMAQGDSPAEAMHRIVTVRPRIYRDARSVGDPFREGVPVIMNLTDADPADAQHLVDFASGLVHALYGKLEKITPRVFLLSPASVEVSRDHAEERAPAFDRS